MYPLRKLLKYVLCPNKEGNPMLKVYNNNEDIYNPLNLRSLFSSSSLIDCVFSLVLVYSLEEESHNTVVKNMGCLRH